VDDGTFELLKSVVELISQQTVEGDEGEGEFDESIVPHDVPLESGDDGAGTAQPREPPLDDIPTQFAAIGRLRYLPILAVVGDEVQSGFGEVFAEGVAVVAAVDDHRHADRDDDLGDAGQCQRGLCDDGGGKVVQRCAVAICDDLDLDVEAAFRGFRCRPHFGRRRKWRR